jgi:Tfp pilus assembly protein PilO
VKKKNKKKAIPLALILGVAVLLAAVAAYGLLIRPKGEEIKKLDADIESLRSEVTLALRPEPEEEAVVEPLIAVADVVELAKALPDRPEMANAILELNAAALGAGVEFTAIQPGAPSTGAGFTQLPIALTFVGSYYELTELVYRLRQLVTVRDGELDADGRLFTIDSLDWHESSDLQFPMVEAILNVSAFVYGNDGSLAVLPAAQPAASATPAPAPAPGSTSPAPAEPGATQPTATVPVDTGQSEPAPEENP